MDGKSFALITEGVSEHQIIKHILQRYLDEEPEINQLQPEIIDGRQRAIGGWNEVLKYCEREENLQTALLLNDYVVIQIDTDQCQTEPFSVPKIENGQPLSVEKLWQRVYNRIMNAIPESIDKSRIIVAICSDTIECWLLPVCCATEIARKHTNQCVNHLNRELRRMNIHPITDKNSNQARKSYATVLSWMKKKREIRDAAQLHYGFSQFISRLDEIPLADSHEKG